MDPVKAEFWRLARNFLTHGQGEHRGWDLCEFMMLEGTSKGHSETMEDTMMYIYDVLRRRHYQHATNIT